MHDIRGSASSKYITKKKVKNMIGDLMSHVDERFDKIYDELDKKDTFDIHLIRELENRLFNRLYNRISETFREVNIL